MSQYLIDKPTNITSMDVIRILRKKGYPRKMGHAGTLDPLATGLLIVCSEHDTKGIQQLVGLEKIYQTTIDLSRDSDTWDTQSREWDAHYDVSTSDDQLGIDKDGQFVPAPTEQAIIDQLESIRGTHDLPLTPFSAKKVDGKKLYHYARAGNPIYMDVPMTVIDFSVLEYSFPILKLELHVGSGTYIRSIAHRLGKQFELGGIVTQLRRTHIGGYLITDAVALDDMPLYENNVTD